MTDGSEIESNPWSGHEGGPPEKARAAAPVPSEWTYAPAPESRDVVSLQERYGLFVGGEFVEPRSGEYFRTIDPAREEVLAEVAQAGPEDVDLAVRAARDAFENGWSKTSVSERAKYCLLENR